MHLTYLTFSIYCQYIQFLNRKRGSCERRTLFSCFHTVDMMGMFRHVHPHLFRRVFYFFGFQRPPRIQGCASGAFGAGALAPAGGLGQWLLTFSQTDGLPTYANICEGQTPQKLSISQWMVYVPKWSWRSNRCTWIDRFGSTSAALNLMQSPGGRRQVQGWQLWQDWAADSFTYGIIQSL